MSRFPRSVLQTPSNHATIKAYLHRGNDFGHAKTGNRACFYMPLHFGRFHPCQFLDDSSHGYAKYSIYLSDDPLAAQRFCCTRLYFSVGAKTFFIAKTVFIQRFSAFPRQKNPAPLSDLDWHLLCLFYYDRLVSFLHTRSYRIYFSGHALFALLFRRHYRAVLSTAADFPNAVFPIRCETALRRRAADYRKFQAFCPYSI